MDFVCLDSFSMSPLWHINFSFHFHGCCWEFLRSDPISSIQFLLRWYGIASVSGCLAASGHWGGEGVCVCSGINESVSTGAWEFRTSIPLCLSDGLMWVFFVVLVWFWWILFILKVMWFLNRKLMMWFLFRFHCHENEIWSKGVRFVVGISFVWANNKKEITSTSSNIYPTNIYPRLLFPRVSPLVCPTGNLISSLNTHVILIRYFSFYD